MGNAEIIFTLYKHPIPLRHAVLQSMRRPRRPALIAPLHMIPRIWLLRLKDGGLIWRVANIAFIVFLTKGQKMHSETTPPPQRDARKDPSVSTQALSSGQDSIPEETSVPLQNTYEPNGQLSNEPGALGACCILRCDIRLIYLIFISNPGPQRRLISSDKLISCLLKTVLCCTFYRTGGKQTTKKLFEDKPGWRSCQREKLLSL